MQQTKNTITVCEGEIHVSNKVETQSQSQKNIMDATNYKSIKVTEEHWTQYTVLEILQYVKDDGMVQQSRRATTVYEGQHCGTVDTLETK